MLLSRAVPHSHPKRVPILQRAEAAELGDPGSLVLALPGVVGLQIRGKVAGSRTDSELRANNRYSMPTPGNVELLSGLAQFGQDLKRTTLRVRTFPR